MIYIRGDDHVVTYSMAISADLIFRRSTSAGRHGLGFALLFAFPSATTFEYHVVKNDRKRFFYVVDKTVYILQKCVGMRLPAFAHEDKLCTYVSVCLFVDNLGTTEVA